MTIEALVSADSITIGNPLASRTIVVFADLRCGACLHTVPELIQFASIDQGYKLVLPHFLPKMDRDSIGLSSLLESVAEEGVLQEFFQQLQENPPLTVIGYFEVAEMLLGHAVRFQAEANSKVIRDRRAATDLRIRNTPFVVLIGPGSARTVLSAYEVSALYKGKV